MIWVQTDDFSPSQIGESSTRMSAAITRSEIVGPLVAVPAVLGHVRPHAGRDVVVDRADESTCTPLARMMSIEMRARPWVFDVSGDRFSVQLMKKALRSE